VSSPAPAPSPTPETLVTKVRMVDGADAAALAVGDGVFLDVDLGARHKDAVPSIQETLKNGPMTWGDGRILSLSEQARPDGGRTVSARVTCYKAGPCKFPGLLFMEGGREAALGEEKELTFATAGQKEKEPEIYSPVSHALPVSLVAGILGGVLLAAIAAYYGIQRYLASRKAAPRIETPPPPPPAPLEELAARFKQLAGAGHLESARFKPYYFGISEALKSYAGRVYGFNAEDCTTRELLDGLKGAGWADESTIEEWMRLYMEMDVVKFTDQSPATAEAQSLMERALNLARKCKGGQA
jgi:hypothetical protein